MKVSLATVSKIAHKMHPTLGVLVDKGIGIYDMDRKFWNDGLVGFVVGVPLTYMIYEPFSDLVPGWYRPVFYVGCAFASFCVQHLLRRVWVFKEVK